MIKLERPQDLTPPSLKRNATKATPWNEPDVRGSLHALQGFVCAYCQTELELVSKTINVEHFYPQKSYPNKKHQWKNLLLCCEYCNSHKQAKFPTKLGTREPLLLNPYTDPISEDIFNIEFLDDYPYVKITANAEHPLFEKTATSIEYLNLDGCGRPELNRDRREALLKQEKSFGKYTPHSLLLKKIGLKQEEKEEELLNFLMKLEVMLSQIHKEMNFFSKKGSEHRYESRKARLEWTFAAIWACHELGDLVEKFISEFLKESQEDITAYYKQLTS